MALRSCLVLQLQATGRPMTVRDLCAGLDRLGLRTPTRASKDVSDALRWEVGRGRIRRVDRGTYQLVHVPRTTAWRMRRRVAAAIGDQGDCRSEAEH